MYHLSPAFGADVVSVEADEELEVAGDLEADGALRQRLQQRQRGDRRHGLT